MVLGDETAISKDVSRSDAVAQAHGRETALREILDVISRSRDDEAPVLDAILKNAMRLCQAPMAALVLGKEGDDHQVLAAHHGAKESTIELYRSGQYPMDPELSLAAKAIVEGRVIHLENMAATDAYREGNPNVRSLVDDQGIRTNLFVPLIAGEGGIGCMILFRTEVRPYTDDQIALVEAFAAQAVIAIENVRQFRELQARLEREEATRSILQVISQSRDDEAPVFEAIMKNAMKLCDAPLSFIFLCNEDRTHLNIVAEQGARPEFLTTMNRDPLPFDPETATSARAVLEKTSVLIDDLASGSLYEKKQPHRIYAVEQEGIRSAIFVPIVSGDQGIGCITVYRREVRPFLKHHVELLEAFAEQAVIAIDNVRQFRELQTRLEREEATRKILSVVSQSRDDTAPVFDVILESVRRLCNAPLVFLSTMNEEQTHVIVPASIGARPEFQEILADFNEPVERSELVAVRAVAEAAVVHVHDCADDDLYRRRDPRRVQLVEVEGVRTILAVPMISSGVAVGAIALYRREVAPFTEDEIALVQGFAAQAAIAIENVKQFKQVQARTREVEQLNSELETRVETQVEELERMGRLKRFLSPQVADVIVSTGDSKMLSSHRALLAILFCDIRGFTAFCETAEPEETIEVLQTYHEEMGKLIVEHGAGVDHRSGDGIMVLFNDPLPCDDPAGDALHLALAMREQMQVLCRKWKRLGHRLGFGVGLSLGYATVGMVGSEGRFDYTASGTAVNLAARLCDHAGDGEILLSPRAFTALEDQIEADSIGELTLKGINAPVEVFRVRDTGPAGMPD